MVLQVEQRIEVDPLDALNALFQSDFAVRQDLPADADPSLGELPSYLDLLNDYQDYSAEVPETEINSVTAKNKRTMFRAATRTRLAIMLGDLSDQEIERLSADQIKAAYDFSQKYDGMGDTTEEKVWISVEEVRETLNVLEIMGVDMSKQRAELDATAYREQDRIALDVLTRALALLGLPGDMSVDPWEYL